MPEAPILEAPRLSLEVSNQIKIPRPSSSPTDEYQKLYLDARSVFPNFPFINGSEHRFIHVDCKKTPLYRSYCDEAFEKRTDFITRYISKSEDRVLGEGESAIFILLHYSSFEKAISFESAEDLLKLWSKKMEDGLAAFASNKIRHPPKVRIKLYEHLEQINHNPMKFYDLKHGSKGDEMALPIIPTIFVDCSPPNFQQTYAGQGLEMLDKEFGVPDFSLFYSILSSKEIDSNLLKELSNLVGSGFNIIQESVPNNSKIPAAHVLNICSVLCTRYLLSEPSKEGLNSDTQVHSLLTESFIGSRKIPNSKATGLLFDEEYFHKSPIDNSCIDWLHLGWKPVGQNVKFYEAIEFYDKELHNCSNGSGSDLREALEIIIGNWKELTFEFLSPDFVYPKRGRPTSKNHLHVSDIYINNVTINTSVWEDINHKIRKCKILSTRENYTNDEFKELYASFSEIVSHFTNEKFARENIPKRKWKSLWDNCNSISHSTVKAENPLSDLEQMGVKFKLISRIQMYDTLRDSLSKLRKVLLKTKEKSAKIHRALCELVTLEIRGGEPK